MVSINSSALAEAEYDDDTGDLRITFRDGSVYTYWNVPRVIYDTLVSTASPGSFYNRDIRNDYDFTYG